MDALDKLLNLAVGAYDLTREKLECITEEMIRRGEMSQDERKKYIEDLLKRIDVSKKELEANLETFVKDAVKKLSVPSKADFERLQAEVESLKKEVKQLKARKKKPASSDKKSDKK